MFQQLLKRIDALMDKSAAILNCHTRVVILFTALYYLSLLIYMLFLSDGIETVFLFALYTLLFYNGVSGVFKAGGLRQVRAGDLPQKVFVAPLLVTIFAALFYFTDNLDLLKDYLQLLETFLSGILIFIATFLLYLLVLRNLAIAMLVYMAAVGFAIYKIGILQTLTGLATLLGGIFIGAAVIYYVARLLKYSIVLGMEVSDRDADNALRLTLTRLGLISSGVYVVMLFMLILVSCS